MDTNFYCWAFGLDDHKEIMNCLLEKFRLFAKYTRKIIIHRLLSVLLISKLENHRVTLDLLGQHSDILP